MMMPGTVRPQREVAARAPDSGSGAGGGGADVLAAWAQGVGLPGRDARPGMPAVCVLRAGVDRGPCPSAADPGRNPHRTGAGWTLRTVAAILANPRYTGRQVWNRQRTDFDLV